MTETQQPRGNIAAVNRTISGKMKLRDESNDPKEQARLTREINVLTRRWFQLAAPRGVRRQKNPAL